jgi:hypothetical protein
MVTGLCDAQRLPYPGSVVYRLRVTAAGRGYRELYPDVEAPQLARVGVAVGERS